MILKKIVGVFDFLKEWVGVFQVKCRIIDTYDETGWMMLMMNSWKRLWGRLMETGDVSAGRRLSFRIGKRLRWKGWTHATKGNASNHSTKFKDFQLYFSYWIAFCILVHFIIVSSCLCYFICSLWISRSNLTIRILAII